MRNGWCGDWTALDCSARFPAEQIEAGQQAEGEDLAFVGLAEGVGQKAEKLHEIESLPGQPACQLDWIGLSGSCPGALIL